MRLIQLTEGAPTTWYHGTPEGQNFTGTFEKRTIRVRYITDVPAHNRLLALLADTERGSDEFFNITDELISLMGYKTITSPIFLSDNWQVANTYADDRRAYDYQAADPMVIEIHMTVDAGLTVPAYGQNFRGISVQAVSAGLKAAGVPDDKIALVLGQFSNAIRGDGDKISTDMLAMISQSFGFDVVDVVGVKDSYNGGGPTTTVRMVFDSSLMHIEK